MYELEYEVRNLTIKSNQLMEDQKRIIVMNDLKDMARDYQVQQDRSHRLQTLMSFQLKEELNRRMEELSRRMEEELVRGMEQLKRREEERQRQEHEERKRWEKSVSPT